MASIHWPTGDSGGLPCAQSNAQETVTEMTEDGYGGDLLIFGGDANYTDVDAATSGSPYRAWYSGLNGDLGGGHHYRDAIFSRCAGVKTCLADNWAISGTRRIDFLFARKGSGAMPAITDAHTVTFNEGDAADQTITGSDRTDRDYSDHRAIMAQVHY